MDKNEQMFSDIYNRIKSYCDQRGTTPTALCKMITGSAGNLATWKKGNIKRETLIEIAAALELPIDLLIYDTTKEAPQIESDNSFIATPHLVAYFDLLGTKDLFKKSDYLNIFKTVYNDIDNNDAYFLQIVQKYENDNKDSLPPISEIKSKIFTDNVVLYMPYTPENLFFSLTKLLYVVAHYQLTIFENTLNTPNPILLRGSICKGELFANNRYIIGKPISEAYMLEKDIANFPRMVLSKELKSMILNDTEKSQALIHASKAILRADFDGELFVNYLGFENTATYKKYADRIKQVIPTLNVEKASQKWQWLLNYQSKCSHNETITVIVDNVQSNNKATIHTQQNIFNSQFCQNISNASAPYAVDEEELINVFRSCTEAEKLMLLGYAKKLVEDHNSK